MKKTKAKKPKETKKSVLITLKAAFNDCKKIQTALENKEPLPTWADCPATWEDITDCINYGIEFLEGVKK